MMVALMLLSCMGTDVLPALAPPKAEVGVTVESAAVASGEPIVVEIQALASSGWEIEAGVPFAEGLSVELLGEDGPTVVDDRTVVTRRYGLSGPDGSYVIGSTEGQGRGPDDQTRSFEAVPVFVDIGVDGPDGGPMDGFAVPPPPPERPTAIYVAAALGLAALLALALWWRRRRARLLSVLPPPVPPHIVAQGAWADARGTISDDHPLAVRLSMILREYLEARSGIPASKATTAEIWESMERMGIDGRPLHADLRSHFAQILDATDRLKFARQGGGEAFFSDLDGHFQAIINQTRPLPVGDDDA